MVQTWCLDLHSAGPLSRGILRKGKLCRDSEHVLPISNSLALPCPLNCKNHETIEDSTWLKIFEKRREKGQLDQTLAFMVS